MSNRLAIVIPFYKLEFFRETLESIKLQTCRRFTLYIGDDASNENLHDLIAEYRGVIDIVYQRFESNVGQGDLVAQWHRCIDLVQDENWIWLFSDDDVMGPKCVEAFYDCLQMNPEEDLFHFNVRIVDGINCQIQERKPFPIRLSTSDFFKLNTTSKIESFVVEYIFRKSVYLATGRFEKFDLAWCADDATWMKFSRVRGIRTIAGPEVDWRYSGRNITSLVNDHEVLQRKINAMVLYIQWVEHFFKTHCLVDETTKFQKAKLPLSMINRSSLPVRLKFRLGLHVLKKLEYLDLRFISFVYLLYLHFKSKIVKAQL